MTKGEAINWLINISSDIGKREHKDLWHYEQALFEIREMLEAQPEQKKGKWIFTESDTGKLKTKCSVCGATYSNYLRLIMNFCPNCGADMRGE